MDLPISGLAGLGCLGFELSWFRIIWLWVSWFKFAGSLWHMTLAGGLVWMTSVGLVRYSFCVLQNFWF